MHDIVEMPADFKYFMKLVNVALALTGRYEVTYPCHQM